MRTSELPSKVDSETSSTETSPKSGLQTFEEQKKMSLDFAAITLGEQDERFHGSGMASRQPATKADDFYSCQTKLSDAGFSPTIEGGLSLLLVKTSSAVPESQQRDIFGFGDDEEDIDYFRGIDAPPSRVVQSTRTPFGRWSGAMSDSPLREIKKQQT